MCVCVCVCVCVVTFFGVFVSVQVHKWYKDGKTSLQEAYQSEVVLEQHYRKERKGKIKTLTRCNQINQYTIGPSITSHSVVITVIMIGIHQLKLFLHNIIYLNKREEPSPKVPYTSA